MNFNCGNTITRAFPFVTVRNSSWRKGYVYTNVCQEFCPQGGGVHCPPSQADTPWQADTPSSPRQADTTSVRQTHPGRRTPPLAARHSLPSCQADTPSPPARQTPHPLLPGRHPPGRQTPPQQAGIPQVDTPPR